ncbi:oxygenase MpaB family protein [Candidatus Rariloculus sp.]|uniref:oxygenase MpaB family protein n=1 Tax=Candidatus Rariloculus sp. TaxID=3101265 RepID=UPI003D0BE698
MMYIPSAHVDGYAKARAVDQEAADNYIRHTTIGDPALDPITEELSSMRPADLHRFIGAGIEQQDEVLRKAPQILRDFIESLDEPPPWLDFDAFRPGIRAFHANVDLMLIAFVTGVLVEGFSTLIAKSFSITGRVSSTKRRLQQNNRHMLDIFFPGGLYRENDGWKLSTRIRFIHSRIRSLLDKSEEWQHEAWGTPVSAAHLGFAISVFSKRLLEYSLQVGARFNEEEKESVLAVWRYAGYLMGIPETILYTTAAEAEEIYKISYLCEPPPDSDSVTVANGLIQAIPSVASVADPTEKKKLTSLAYRLSRALIGNRLSSCFEFPSNSTFGTLLYFRMKQRVQRTLKGGQLVRADNFSQLMQIAVYDEHGLSYKMPDHVKHSKSASW